MRGWVLGALVVALVAAAVALAALMGEGGEGVPGAGHPYFLTWKTTARPPLSYEDVDSDDGDAVTGAAAQHRPLGVAEVLDLLQEDTA